MTDQKIRDRLLGGVCIWFGDYGHYEVPAEVSALVKDWDEDGWPALGDPGRPKLLAWAKAQEDKARAEMGL